MTPPALLRFARVTNFVEGLCWDVHTVAKGEHLGRVWVRDGAIAFWPDAGKTLILTPAVDAEVAAFCAGLARETAPGAPQSRTWVRGRYRRVWHVLPGDYGPETPAVCGVRPSDMLQVRWHTLLVTDEPGAAPLNACGQCWGESRPPAEPSAWEDLRADIRLICRIADVDPAPLLARVAALSWEHAQASQRALRRFERLQPADVPE